MRLKEVGKRLSPLIGDWCLDVKFMARIAEALGVVVEPDDVPLPKVIVATQGGYTPCGYGLGFTTDDKSWRGHIEIRLDCPADEYAGKRLADELVAVYNASLGVRPISR